LINVKTPNLSKTGSKELYFMIVPLISDLTTQRQAKKENLLECAGSKTEVACVNLFCDKNKYKNSNSN